MSDYNAKTDWVYDEPVTEGDINRWEQGIKDAHEKAGQLDKLNTQEKNNLVSSINELKDEIGSLDELNTETKSNFVASLNEIHDEVMSHLANDTKHITQEEREEWNNKLSKDGGVIDGKLNVSERVNFQKVRRYHHSRSGIFGGITEIGRFVMTDSHDQVWLKGSLHCQSGIHFRGLEFEILARTTFDSMLDRIAVYQEGGDSSSSSLSNEIKVYYKQIPKGAEIVVCLDSGGIQFASYEILYAKRRTDDSDEFLQSDMNSEFNTSGYSTDKVDYGVVSKYFINNVKVQGNKVLTVVEEGSNSYGNYVIYSDGTVYMWRIVTLNLNTTTSQLFDIPVEINTIIFADLSSTSLRSSNLSGLSSLAVRLDSNHYWEVSVSDTSSSQDEVNVRLFGMGKI